MTDVQTSTTKARTATQNYVLQKGEHPLKNAPQIILSNGLACIPQHFLTYDHTRETVEAVLEHIAYNPHYLLFVSEDGAIPYIQIGIIGYDNYKATASQLSKKIVFGRRWRVEPNLPTSEIIQTAFLALKKAREHEIRECFKICWEGYSATPFNSHQDLPLIARNQDLIEQHSPSEKTLEDCLSSIRFKKHSFTLTDLVKRKNGHWIIDLSHPTEEDLISIILTDLTEDTLFYSLMDKLIELSNRHVDENFTYRGFARFSRKNSVAALAEISASTRGSSSTLNCANSYFDKNLAQEKYDTDSSRVPQLSNSHYSNELRKQLEVFDIKTGFKPK